MLMSRSLVLAALVCCALAAPSGAAAQSALVYPSVDPALALAPATTGAQSARRTRSRGSAIAKGALIGAGAALVITGWASAKYGENEGGRFCVQCMMQWSAIAVPIGAGVGAGIGFAVASARPSMAPGSQSSWRPSGVVITARF